MSLDYNFETVKINADDCKTLLEFYKANVFENDPKIKKAEEACTTLDRLLDGLKELNREGRRLKNQYDEQAVGALKQKYEDLREKFIDITVTHRRAVESTITIEKHDPKNVYKLFSACMYHKCDSALKDCHIDPTIWAPSKIEPIESHPVMKAVVGLGQAVEKSNRLDRVNFYLCLSLTVAVVAWAVYTLYPSIQKNYFK